MNSFDLCILAADKPFYEGKCVSLVLPMLSGQYGIQANHSNLVAAVVPGELDYSVPTDGGLVRVRAAVSEGIVKVENDRVLVLVDTAERPEDIDENRARRAAEEAKEELLHRQSRRAYFSAQAQLARAMNRLRIKRSSDEPQ